MHSRALNSKKNLSVVVLVFTLMTADVAIASPKILLQQLPSLHNTPRQLIDPQSKQHSKYQLECFGCSKPFKLSDPYFKCHLCNCCFHPKCTICLQHMPYEPLTGDDMYEYSCATCTKSCEDTLFRYKLSWTDVAHIIMLHLTLKYESQVTFSGRKFYHWKTIIDHTRVQWAKFWTKNLQKNWVPQLAETLISLENIDRFERAPAVLNVSGYYALVASKSPLQYHRSALPSVAYRVTVQGSLIPFSKLSVEQASMNGLSIGVGEMSQVLGPSGDTPHDSSGRHNQKLKKLKGLSFRSDIAYTPFEFELPNPLHGPVKLSKNLSDPSVVVTPDALTVFMEKGYRLAKATHGVMEGCWYFEILIHAGEARVGWSNVLAELSAPLGYDEHGYSYSSKTGDKFHCRIGTKYAQNYGVGDVIGCLIHLPKLPVIVDGDLYQRELAICDRIKKELQQKYPPVKHHSIEFQSEMPILRGSFMKFYKNGIDQDVAFENLYHAKYRPSVSCYHGTAVINFGPHFKYPPPPLSIDANSESFSIFPISHLDENPIGDLSSSFTLDSCLTYFQQQEKRRSLMLDPTYRHPLEVERDKTPDQSTGASPSNSSKVVNENRTQLLNLTLSPDIVTKNFEAISSATVSTFPTDM